MPVIIWPTTSIALPTDAVHASIQTTSHTGRTASSSRRMEIQIPSPSVFLTKSPAVSAAVPVQPAQKKSVKPRGSSKKKSVETAAVTKIKQTKSRNGCSTCKKKRLKCDETKPGCVQCQKRNVECEGYKKEYKWRDFKESSFNPKSSHNHKRSGTSKDRNSSPGLESAFASASSAFHDEVLDDTVLISPVKGDGAEMLNTMLPELTFSISNSDLPSPGSSFTLDTTSLPSTHDFGSVHSSAVSESPSLLSLLASTNNLGDSGECSDGMEDGIDETVPRETGWMGRCPSPAPSNRSDSSKSTAISVLTGLPGLDMSSPEMLLARFDQHTCGILSVKDGPTENPWRTLIWPLAQDSQALYHAISAMTAFHGAYHVPQLRVAGVAHMTKSIRNLAGDIGNMRIDSALATSLALALSEGWDEKISTGIQHLRGAKIMVNSALVKHQSDLQQGQLTSQDAVRLKFLCHTFIYLDVIARLTSREESQPFNFDDILMAVNPPTGDLVEVDPLMGCATTLFPLIGQVASLIQRVRRTDNNSLTIVSQAMDLKQKLVQWKTPDHYSVERPEDPSTEVQHAIQTAEAYRFATLLYLHQAVPEIPSQTSDALAKKVLLLLASVPPSSRTTIVQIFPLFAASCEVTLQEDRSWVIERWAAMMSRLHIGNVDHCWDVVQEVWRRRDEFDNEKAQRLMRRYTSRGLSTGSMIPGVPPLPQRVTASDSPFDQIEPEYTVRGSLHWIGVMSEWNWEVFLG